MKNNLPQLHLNLTKQIIHKQPSHKKIGIPSKINVKGITLRQYFRLCDQNQYQNCIKQTQQQSKQSSKSSLAETPTFNNQPRRNIRIKIKTQISQQNTDSYSKNLILKQQHHHTEAEATNRSVNMQNFEKSNKMMINLRENNPFRKKQSRKKLLSNFHSNSNRNQQINTTAISYLYQAQDNKNKMLKKIQFEKQRINDLRLSQAFIITKYGSKFRIDTKDLVKNQ